MTVSFDSLKIGHEYERPFLANLWGYKSFHAISRGVITPSGSNFIILFVTKEKQEALTQYRDYLDDMYLHWEGEEKHSSDGRIIGTLKTEDEIHLFYREIHHSPFIYHGRIYLEKYEEFTDRPSQFVFLLGNHEIIPDPLDDI
jgi:putative restriction endonuclease